jgi:hypothetical protein
VKLVKAHSGRVYGAESEFAEITEPIVGPLVFG